MLQQPDFLRAYATCFLPFDTQPTSSKHPEEKPPFEPMVTCSPLPPCPQNLIPYCYHLSETDGGAGSTPGGPTVHHLLQRQLCYILFPSICLSCTQRRIKFSCMDVRSALASYLCRTKPFRVSPRLFVSITDRMKSQQFSMQRVSKWVWCCILTCYENAGEQSPHKVTARSTSALVHIYSSNEGRCNSRNLQFW